MNPPKVGRLFLGIPLTAEVRDALAAHLGRVFGGGLPGRPVRAENWHVTLRFLGDTDAARHAALVDALAAAHLGAAFDLSLGAPGAFPRPARASVLWVGVGDGEQRVRELAAICEDAAVRAGFAAERRPFAPHLTVSRIDPPADVRSTIAGAAPVDARMRVDGITLFRSHLGGGPPRYERLHTFPLD